MRTKPEICRICGRSVKLSDGLFINRVVSFDDDKFICRECEEEMEAGEEYTIYVGSVTNQNLKGKAKRKNMPVEAYISDVLFHLFDLKEEDGEKPNVLDGLEKGCGKCL